MIILARCPDYRNPVPLVHYNEYGLIVGEQKAKYYRETNLDLVRRKRATGIPRDPLKSTHYVPLPTNNT
jgi:hypothetical protein